MEELELLGKNIKRIRLNKGYSILRVSKKLYVTPQALSLWEHGGGMSLENFIRICKLYQVNPKELLSFNTKTNCK